MMKLNPKSEYRNPKQILRLGRIRLQRRIRMFQFLKLPGFEFWSFDIVSNFGFRASNLISI